MLCKTQAHRHQMHQLTRDSLTNDLDANKMEHQETYTLNMSEMQPEVKECLRTVNHMEHILRVKSATYDGITYSSGLCVTLGENGIYCLLGILKSFFFY